MTGDGKAAQQCWLRALGRSSAGRQSGATLPLIVAAQAERTPDAPALLGDGVALTYADLAARICQYAGWALAYGVRSGDTVCLLMANSPEYVAIWLGITRVGGVVALLNTNLAGDALLHCARAAAPRHVIAGPGFEAGLATLASGLDQAVGAWLCGARDPAFRTLDAATFDSAAVAAHAPPSLRETALLIYTSGTTGLPKAARVSHARICGWSHWFAGLTDATASDRMYNCLPLYHSVGGVVAVGALLVSGGAVVIRERFSASRFWDEVAAWDCTLFQYIGELCRYLLNAPPPHRPAHRLRLCIGNGLRGDVWERFQAQFAIPAIIEFYAATEGNVSLYNCEGRPGAVGRVPGFLAHRFGAALARCDPETGALLRDPDGRGLACAPDEPGELLGRIEDGNFEGYTDAAASARKVARDVFEAGDSWFRTGDLMRKDAAGFYYFVDRLGDTFRWKGENVSTAEVADVVAACANVADAVVFGVRVDGAEGRAGMAAIVPGAGFDLAAFEAQVASRLPGYARPVFLRLCARIEATGTFKLSKTRLAHEGYGPNEAGEPCYVHDPARGYVRLVEHKRI